MDSPARSNVGRGVIAGHGGAGTIARSRVPPERERLCCASITAALEAGEAILEGGVELVPNHHFSIPRRREQLELARKADIVALDHEDPFDMKHGTVGAVAVDAHGSVAAATSTGGLTYKAFGRVGNSPLIGCGTYANDATCAMSCTGKGEEFVRHVVGHDLHCLMAYQGLSLEESSAAVFDKGLGRIPDVVGLIAIDREGNVAAPCNTQGMYRGWLRVGESAPTVAIYES